MDDLRQKLFPIFLGEAERNLNALRQFLSYQDLAQASSDELEAAFRAAHTLKGTADLVKAESICKISRRLEAMLERHFEARTVPTPVEHEALKLAVDWVSPLVAALQGDLQEPTLFVKEALQALDLAEAFPGRTPLVELIDSQEERRAPMLDDPFADDPSLLSEEGSAAVSDPFADDPAFGMELDLVNGVADKQADNADDPFAEDDDFSVAENANVEAQELKAETEQNVESAEPLPFDPFAEDTLGLDVEDALPVVRESEEPVSEEPDEEPLAADEVPVDESVEGQAVAMEDPFAEDDFDLGVDTASLASEPDNGPVADPFAEDDDFSESVEDAAETEEAEETADPFSASPEQVAERAEKIAESLLLPDQESAPRKEYVCCVFKIGERDYHLPIKQMKEITDLPQVLPLPLAPPMVSGLINLRGEVLPVINLAILNNHQQAEVRVQRRLVVAEYLGESLSFLADGVPYLAEEFNGEKIDMADFLSLYKVRGVE
ncbi:Hpt domain-containing protein [Malonomonas rubra DSM 5091]|uniref:Hpt domain-containing protein n=1 Tax=Malonomonas rubra DSM 5091 TaxID=1122189 RepID=A0A1M6BFV2_MALRU|nr:chemotaxis protein CheW [Malonomonas rubra]SHI47557.1 Hpt domain-containing protein [Malonomonas rubra DSM 5091]